MKDIQQLIKKSNEVGRYDNVFPKTFIDAIKDRETGVSLKEILSSFNMFFLPYVGSKTATRLLLPKSFRRQGVWLTYVTWNKTVVIEWYDNDAIDDTSFGDDVNWRQGSNMLVGDITINTEGNWVINGEDTGIPARGELGITPILRVSEDNRLEVSYNEGNTWNSFRDIPVFIRYRVHNNKLQESIDFEKTWEDVSDYIGAWFRWNKISEIDGTLQISRDEKKTWEDISPIIATDVITNSEDIIKNDSKELEFANKEYNPELFSGLGRVYLRKNIVDGKNILTQEMVNKSNTRYIIQYDYDLDSKEIIIPENCVLEFNHGTINDGILVGNNTKINSNIYNIFNNITINGIWNIRDIYSEWFDFYTDENIDNLTNFNNLIALSSDNILNNIYILEGVFYINLDSNNGIGLNIRSNTTIHNNASIRIKQSSLELYYIILIKKQKNIKIVGGEIIGDVSNHNGNTGEWGMGIGIISSENIYIQDVTIKNCWGDGIYIGQISKVREDCPNNIFLENVICDNNRRLGLSIITAKDLYINNCKFINTGRIKYTAPGAGIDIEPNIKDAILQNINIQNTIFTNNKSSSILILNTDNTSSIKINNITADGNIYMTGDFNNNIQILNSTCNSITNSDNSIKLNIVIKDCIIVGALEPVLNNKWEENIIQDCVFEKNNSRKNIYKYFGNPADKNIIKLTLPKFHGICKISIIADYNARNLNTKQEYLYLGDYFYDEYSVYKEGVNIYTHSGNDSPNDIEDWLRFGIFSSYPILNTSNNTIDIYFKNNYTYGAGVFNIEIVGKLNDNIQNTTLKYISTKDIPEITNFNSKVINDCMGSINNIKGFAIPSKGSTVYVKETNKIAYGNGTKWLYLDGTAI